MAWNVEHRRPSDSRHSPESFWSRGGAWVLAQVLVMTGWLIVTPKGQKPTGSVFARVVAATLLSAGAAAAASGTWMLGKSLTPFPEPREQAQLVRQGTYSLMRHPVYAGLIALSLGWACLWGSRRGLALALLQAVLLDAKARREERWLREKFPEYDRYAAKVRRLIPGIY
jgi:protein-S-isoprenylcysteine O-methyltransferase Ste14